jgi:hypothetical protein
MLCGFVNVRVNGWFQGSILVVGFLEWKGLSFFEFDPVVFLICLSVHRHKCQFELACCCIHLYWLHRRFEFLGVFYLTPNLNDFLHTSSCVAQSFKGRPALLEPAYIWFNNHVVLWQVFFQFMDNHFAKGFFGLPQHCTVVLSSLLALLNNLSYFAADAIGLEQDIVADLGCDIVFMKHEVFFLKAFRGRHYFCRRRTGPLNSNLKVV